MPPLWLSHFRHCDHCHHGRHCRRLTVRLPPFQPTPYAHQLYQQLGGKASKHNDEIASLKDNEATTASKIEREEEAIAAIEARLDELNTTIADAKAGADIAAEAAAAKAAEVAAANDLFAERRPESKGTSNGAGGRNGGGDRKGGVGGGTGGRTPRAGAGGRAGANGKSRAGAGRAGGRNRD